MNIADSAGQRSGRGRPDQARALRDCARRPRRRRDLVAAMPIRRIGVTLGLTGLLLTGAAAAPGGIGPAAFAAGHQTGWRIVPSPNRARSGDNTLMQVSAGPATSAWAVGYDGQLGSFRTLAERWNGAKWALARSPNPSPLDNVLYGVATLSRTSAWAVGYDLANVSPTAYHRALIEHWNGSTWQVVPTPRAGPSDSDLWGVTALSATNAWAVGNENTGTFRFRPLVEHWNGHAWGLVRVPSPPLTGVGASLFGVAATSPRNIWAVGNYATGTRFQPLIEHFNGARWALVHAPVPGSAQLNRISLDTPGNGWAVGIRGTFPHTQARWGVRASTSARPLPGITGEVTGAQWWPFQCSMRAWVCGKVPRVPTAQPLRGVSREIRFSCAEPGTGAGTSAQWAPLKCSISGWNRVAVA